MRQKNKIKHLIVIQGPTASGKTDFAIELARYFKTEIISADSRQFFREMSIGTAKPSFDEQKGIKHHFIDSHSIEEDVSAARFEREASLVLEDLFKRNDFVVLVGGSGMFIDALCNGLDEIPHSTEIRNELTELWENGNREMLLEELHQKDPVFFEIIDKNNPTRVIRALEAVRLTKKPFSELRTNQSKEKNYELHRYVIDYDREKLYDRINMRVDAMIQHGLIEEVRKLLPFRDCNSMRTVGYKELVAYFDGQCTLDEAIELIKQNSRRYAKRQVTWLKRYDDALWIQADSAENMKKNLLEHLNKIRV
ncbi:MAG: tRNA (adenosine(37)-N6)-dimethylallyltransferase MiaA [Crocinitomicaceae bacterium]|nr:tRNA (adenosine(37)-N6)-dimethylallyltransferase MiaA [Crocinitomicaceae bacterium]MCF8434307.1 tRNA (adenosine(37)-N6)-dimethylallyltransferase MiaA [Crocinitomicaceae bacterium]